MDERVVVVETLLDGQLSEGSQLDRVRSPTTVNRNQITSFEIEDIAADCARSNIDRVVGGEITVAPSGRCLEVPKQPALSWLGLEITDGLPRCVDTLGGLVAMGGPLPAGSKIEVTVSPVGIPPR
ncbi:hypothetical protein ABNG03_19555, partial [Halorubrum sp. RMP-47]